MTKLNKRKSSFIIAAVALAILSTLLAAICYMTGKRDVVVASAADTSLPKNTLTMYEGVSFSYPGQDLPVWRTVYQISEDNLSLKNYSDYTFEVVGATDTVNSLVLMRSETEPNLREYPVVSYSEFNDMSWCRLNPEDDGDMVINGVSYTKGYWTGAEPENNKKYYYYIAIVSRVTTYYFGSVLVDSVHFKVNSSNYLYFSYAEKAQAILENSSDTMSEERLRYFRNMAGLDTTSETFEVTLNYKSVENVNSAALEQVSETYTLKNLWSQSKTWVFGQILNASGRNNINAFNVVHREKAIGKDESGNDKGYLIDEYTLLEAEGYEYVFDATTNTGTVNITYKPFQAKDLAITVTSDQDNDLTAFLRSGNIVTENGITTITFDTDNLSARLSNCFDWEVTETVFDNYQIENPYESSGKVKIMKNYTTNANGTRYVSSLTVTTTDAKLLVDVVIRLSVDTLPPIDLDVYIRYVKLQFADGVPTAITIEKKLDKAIKSNLFTKLSVSNILNGYVKTNDGVTETIIPAQREFLESALVMDELNGAEWYNISQITTNRQYAAGKGYIYVDYDKNNLFAVTDMLTGDTMYIKEFKENSLIYKGAELAETHDGYRISNISSEDLQLASVNIPFGVRQDDWLNANIQINVQRGGGYIIPFTVVYTDKWKVRVEALENFTYIPESGADKGKVTASGFARKKIVEKEVLLSTFGDVYNPTEEELKNYLGFQSLTVIGAFGTWDKENTTVTFADDMYTIKMAYYGTTVQIRQSDGDTVEYVRIPLSCYAEWCDGFGKDWTIQALNYSYTNDSDTGNHVVFKSEGDVKREDLYGYFYVAVFREKVVNLDSLFAGYNADGCRVFYKSKEVRGDSVYRFFSSNQWLLPTIGGTVGLLFGHPVVGAAIGTAAQYTFMSIEEMNSDTGTFYSYFSFVDGSSSLPYAANNKAEDAFDDDSGFKNTIRHGLETIKEFFDEKIFNNPKLKYIFWVIVGLLAYAMLTCAFNKMGINTGIFSYIWLGICAALIAVAIYFGITIFIL